ncbi:MAG: transposase family protein, partial [Spirochaetaceae bacterium]|nr:transposase family protein [Spirochaetaceae bacterium]
RYALKNKAFTRVFQAIDNALSLLPLPIRILHSDNGSEFIRSGGLIPRPLGRFEPATPNKKWY